MDQSKKRKAYKMVDINLTSWVKVQQKHTVVKTEPSFFSTFFYYVRNSVNLQKKVWSENQQPAIKKSSKLKKDRSYLIINLDFFTFSEVG